MRPGLQALGRLPTGTMNKTEAAYAEHLKLRLIAGEILWWAFEPFTIRLAKLTSYKPDFAVLAADGTLECHEIKGYWEDDARVKIKVAAEHMPFKFIAIKAEARKRGGGWIVEEF